MSEAACETREIAIADLVQHRAFQVRRRLDEGRINTYAAGFRAEGTISETPILVGRICAPAAGHRGRPSALAKEIRPGALVLLAGYHRVAACTKIGKDTILAEIVDTDVKEARWLAAQSNLAHGLPLKPAEVRAAFEAFVHAGHYRDPEGKWRSLRDMGRIFGKHHETIRAWLDVPKFRWMLRHYELAPEIPKKPPESDPPDPVEETMLSIDEALSIAKNLWPAMNTDQRQRLVESMRTTLRSLEETEQEDAAEHE